MIKCPVNYKNYTIPQKYNGFAEFFKAVDAAKWSPISHYNFDNQYTTKKLMNTYLHKFKMELSKLSKLGSITNAIKKYVVSLSKLSYVSKNTE